MVFDAKSGVTIPFGSLRERSGALNVVLSISMIAVRS